MSWNPWSDAARLRAENSSLKSLLSQETKRLTKALEHEKMVSKVFHDANHKLISDIDAARRELDMARRELDAATHKMATMHRRDPVTGRLLPRGK